MTAVLMALVLAAPGTIRVRVEGPATEVVALQAGIVVARAEVREGVALLTGLPDERVDLQARGPESASLVTRGVRTVHDDAPGFDAVLRARAVHPVSIRTDPGATVWVGGVAYPGPDLRLPAGLHKVVVDHPERVSSAERLVRVAGPVELDMPLESGLVVTGLVTDAQGAPIAGAQVAAFADGFFTKRSDFTDAGGRFGVAGFRGHVVSLRVRAPGYAERLHRVVFFPGDERARARIELRPGAGVVLRVVDAQERPVLHAEGVLLPAWYEETLEEPRLRANHEPARRRGGAALRFDGLAPGRSYRILVTAPGQRPATTESFTAPAAGTRRALPQLALEPAAAIDGRVKGARAGPAGLTVVCQGPEGESVARTDRAGRFRFDGLDPGAHVLYVRDEDETGHRVALAADDRHPVLLVCRAADEERLIFGFVWDMDSRPLPGVEVEAAGRRAVTDEHGAFILTHLPVGRDRFSVTLRPGPGCRALVDDPHLPHVERKVALGATLRQKLLRSGRLWVRLNARGRSLARARLHISSGTTGVRLKRQLPRRAREIVVDELPVGPVVVDVAAPGVLGTSGAVVAVVRDPEKPTEVAVGAGRSVRGKLVQRRTVRRATGPPAVADFALGRGWVTLLDGDPLRALATVPVEADGTFLLEGLPLAPVLLVASAPGLPVASARVDLTEQDARGVILALQDATEAAIRVVVEKDAPLPATRVRVQTEHGVDIRDLAALGRFRRVVAGEEDLEAIGPFFRLRRGAAGRIAAPFVQPGSYRFLVSADGYKPARVGVRARSARTVKEIREKFPDTPPDLASPVRLVRAPREPARKD